MIDLNKRMSEDDYKEFAMFLQKIQRKIDFKVSARGWAYTLETERLINKDQFDKVNNIINSCRRKGYLPIDFVAEETARAFTGVEKPTKRTVLKDYGEWLEAAKNCAEYYTPDWWHDEHYYIQMLVEKVDLVTLFEPICAEYHIPIANARGWSSMLQRAEYAKRFAKAHENGLECVLLYCGDHDPDGLRISEFIRNNLADLKNVRWKDGTKGYDPDELIIDRFGLNYDFIKSNNLTWIDNLITGSKKDLASPSHKNFKMPYVQAYLKKYGARKCEANAVVTMPTEARELVRDVIENYVGTDALDRFEVKRQAVRDELAEEIEETGVGRLIDDALEIINNR